MIIRSAFLRLLFVCLSDGMRMNWLRSDAIEGADVMLYGVSLAYKESSNCRLEANYAHQQELDMCALYSYSSRTLSFPHSQVRMRRIPLMMTKGYSPKGCASRNDLSSFAFF